MNKQILYQRILTASLEGIILLCIIIFILLYLGFPGGSDGKDSTCNGGGPGLIPGSGRSAGEGNGYPLQSFCLENSMDTGVYKQYQAR